MVELMFGVFAKASPKRWGKLWGGAERGPTPQRSDGVVRRLFGDMHVVRMALA